MPELPEVESLMRGLKPHLIGQTIRRIFVHKPKLVSGKGNIRTASLKKKEEFIAQLEGERFFGIERVAKNLIFHFTGGKALVVHLKMSGQLVYREGNENAVIGGHPIEISEMTLPNKHSHVHFVLDRGTLFYNDTRMFGYLLYHPDIKTLREFHGFGELGQDPLSEVFTWELLQRSIKGKKVRLKTLLMGQSVVTGLGNIYCDEACFRAGVRPARLAGSLTTQEIKKLHRAIRDILLHAIELGGSSVANYRLADGSRGNYAREHKVYGKAGQPCFVCKRPLTRTVINSRTTVFCKVCQR